MDNARLEKLKASLETNPDDPFTRYLVALECVKLSMSDEAEDHFRNLVVKHKNYVPTYYQYGQLLETLGRKSEALTIYEAGLTAARAAGDMHTASELQAALDLL